jgi:3-phosphoshikimate 1-carboxyvinyltransferase
MSQPLSIAPADSIRFSASHSPPGSKSISNRALLCAALGRGESSLTGLLDCEDTRVMATALSALGVSLEVDWAGGLARLTGSAGTFSVRAAQLDCRNSGTTLRFLAACLAATGGDYLLDGNPRMRQRPAEDLLLALNQLGSNARSLNSNGCPPIEIKSSGCPGGSVSVRGDKSSQFLSGLLLAAPLARSPVTIEVAGQLVSQPYVDLTLGVMQQFGVEVQRLAESRFEVAPQPYLGTDFAIEPDASSASYFFAAAAICQGTTQILRLGTNSLQGDLRFVELLKAMGCDVQMTSGETKVTGSELHGIDCTMTEISDTVQTLAAVALFARGPTRIRGVAHIRYKESDRISDLARELRRAGATVEEQPDGLVITPTELHPTEFQTYDDHRMAMSLALVGLRENGITVADPNCVTKTYPNYFRDLQRVTGCRIS